MPRLRIGKAFHGVRVDRPVLAIKVAANAVERGAMLGKLAAQLLIHLRFVGHDPAFAADVGANDRVNLNSAEPVEGEGAHGAAVAIHQRQNAQSVSVTAARPLARLLIRSRPRHDLAAGCVAQRQNRYGLI